ncbi:MAG: hypothetical protein ACI915_004737 [Gammaproteobacteria bacterium]|jgi:hypothetical protein
MIQIRNNGRKNAGAAGIKEDYGTGGGITGHPRNPYPKQSALTLATWHVLSELIDVQ